MVRGVFEGERKRGVWKGCLKKGCEEDVCLDDGRFSLKRGLRKSGLEIVI